jgi:hypothetical protein
VVAAPGEQFEASVWAYSPSDDSILGTENFTNITLSFVNAEGDVIGSVNFGPGTNQKDTPIFDGRDPNLIEDEWIQYTVNAVAPAETAFVRVSNFFIQLNNQGGAVWFDNASLVRLTADVAPVPGDYNGDGAVSVTDYTVWRDHLGDVNEAGINNNGDGGGVTASDYTWWRSRFGSVAGGGGEIAVPEPSAWLLIGGVVVAAVLSRRS